MLRISVLLLALCASCGGAAKQGTEERAGPPLAPEQEVVTPLHYRLTLELDPNARGFRGHVEIDVELRKPTNVIRLHSVGLEIESASISGARGEEALQVSLEPEREQIVLSAERPLLEREATLRISFAGPYRAETGVFRQLHDGQWYVFTDFQPIDARAAFPCFDLPSYRATFSTTLVVPKGLVAASNAPEASRVSKGPFEYIQFERTRPLPTYLVAAAVGPFDIVNGEGVPFPLRALVLRGRAAEVRSALGWLPHFYRSLSEYLGSAGLPRKLDLVAVPRLSGAMENHGMFLFSADLLLLGEKAPEAQRQLVRMVVAHEVSHLWFGNSVGISRWNDLWLSEGFATLMADEAVADLHPGDGIDARRIVYRQDAMLLDREPVVRAVNELGPNVRDTEDAFDPLSYKKAGAILEMAKERLGKKRFRSLVREYVDEAKGETVPSSLLLSMVRNRDPFLARSMRALLSQSGIPSISGELSCEQSGARVLVSQSRYRWKVAAEAGEPSGGAPSRVWPLSVCVTHESGPKREVTCRDVESPRASIPLSACPSKWTLNAAGQVYARHSLGAQALERIPEPRGAREWAVLVDAVDGALEAGSLVPDRKVFELLGKALAIQDQHVTDLVLRIVGDLSRHVADGLRLELWAAIGPVITAQARAALGKSAGLYENVHGAALLRLVASSLGDPHTATRLRQRALSILAGKTSMADPIAVVALESFARNLTPADVEEWIRRSEAENARSAIETRMQMLALVGRPDAAARVLERVALSPKLRGYTSSILALLASRPATAEVALRFVAKGWRRSLPARALPLVRRHFAEGLCKGEMLDRLNRALPTDGEEGEVALRVKRCAARRKLWRQSPGPSAPRF